MLVDYAIRSGCAHVERYGRGALGPRLPASEGLQTSKVTCTQVLIGMAVLLLMVRSKLGPFPTRFWRQPCTPKLVVCSSLMLPSVLYIVPFSLIVALYSMAGLPTRLVPIFSKGFGVNLCIPNKHVIPT